MLMKIEGAIKNGQSRETGNIGHTEHRKKTNTAKTQQIIYFLIKYCSYCAMSKKKKSLKNNLPN